MSHDVAIIGGGPAGLSAALALGRAGRRVVIFDAGPPRNARAELVHNFLSRDGTPPSELRRISYEQLRRYPSVEARAERVEAIAGARGAFQVRAGGTVVDARRVILCTGMVDQMLPFEGFRELWGHAIFQCPYCHGWEHRERPWGYLATTDHAIPFAIVLRGWSPTVTLFTHGELELDDHGLAQLEAAGVRVEATPIARFQRNGSALEGVELTDGRVVACEALYAHPPQRQVDLVASLELELDDLGFVRVDPMSRETSRSGIYAAGDLTTRGQGAIFAAATGAQAAGMLNHELTLELATAGQLGVAP